MTRHNICRKVEETSGLTPSTPKQFEILADLIYSHTGQPISPTTLKRIWGYIDEPLSTRRTTLDILARYCGWKNYDDFRQGNIPEAESGKVGTKSIIVEKEMKRGERLRIMWPPARVCIVEYLGQKCWKILESEGTRLKAGDTFCCSLIAEGEPLYLDNLVHDSMPTGIYVCGRKSGISFIREES
ncbi:MAG: hypothetical protein K2H86_05045 [Muribaculaceae bacterium]|nr:hypothetical protein [Muribaculaceae bacterium]